MSAIPHSRTLLHIADFAACGELPTVPEEDDFASLQYDSGSSVASSKFIYVTVYRDKEIMKTQLITGLPGSRTVQIRVILAETCDGCKFSINELRGLASPEDSGKARVSKLVTGGLASPGDSDKVRVSKLGTGALVQHQWTATAIHIHNCVPDDS